MSSRLQTRGDRLSISCVIFDTDASILNRTLAALKRSVDFAIATNVIKEAELHLINNNTKNKEFAILSESQRLTFPFFFAYNGHGNIGYGRGNNLAIAASNCEYHLIINPDVDIDEHALAIGIKYLQSNLSVGIVAPHATNSEGGIEYLAKRNPSIFTIFLRSFNNEVLTRTFQSKLDEYTYRNCLPTEGTMEIELASGCFMLCRMSTLKQVRGFSEKYFLYFEDFDLSRRVQRIAKIIYLPIMHICHYGGNTSRKGFKHKYHFLRSALRYFTDQHSL